MTITAASPHVMNTYGRLPIAMARGEGCYLWDVNGKRYLDALGGIAVNTLGHAHPQLVKALHDEERVLRTSEAEEVEEERARRKREAARGGAEAAEAAKASGGLEAYVKQWPRRDLQVRVTDVHVRFDAEHVLPGQRAGFEVASRSVCGLTLRSLHWAGCDAQGRPVFGHQARAKGGAPCTSRA